MTSILTNVSAMAALQTLRSVNTNLQDTQNRVSSGYRIGEAKDNAAYWSIATTMRSDNKAVNAAADALGLGAAKVDVAYSALESALDVVDEIKAKVASARESSVDATKVNDEITQLNKQLLSIANSASFNGENWLVSQTSHMVVTAFVRTSAGVQVTIETTNATSFALFGADASGMATTTGAGILSTLAGINATSLNSTNIGTTLTTVETALQALTLASATLGSLSKRIDLQSEFAKNLSDSIETGVSRLVDANMEEESAKLTALQTQQQLAVQSLSIANSSAENILTLFRQ